MGTACGERPPERTRAARGERGDGLEIQAGWRWERLPLRRRGHPVPRSFWRVPLFLSWSATCWMGVRMMVGWGEMISYGVIVKRRLR